MQAKLALPKGPLQGSTAALLEAVGLGLADYTEKSRSYRPRCGRYQELFVKVFHEKDIAVQVATGNYDLGICGRDWIDELLVKYPSDAVVKVRDLGYGRKGLYVAASPSSGVVSLGEVRERWGRNGLRLVSEYPNLAESFALKQRLGRVRIFPVWGAAEAYPPENAELALVSAPSQAEVQVMGLIPLATWESSAYLIANKNSLERLDLSGLLGPFCRGGVGVGAGSPAPGGGAWRKPEVAHRDGSSIYLALPDGHQQRHMVKYLERCGLKVHGYSQGNRRPSINMEGVVVKVIRPQDMPLQVANQNFDLAITGRDWLLDHKSRFPSSPVKEMLALGFGQVRVVAVVANDFAASDMSGLREMAKRLPTLRVASEYVNIADKFARDNHLAPYKVIPTWGASEAFLPEDADLLVENTETGATLARHNLRIVETLFQSSACLIGNANPPGDKVKMERIARLVEVFRRAAPIGGGSVAPDSGASSDS